MLIRYGYNLEIEVSQPTTLLTALDIHPSRRGDIVEERPIEVEAPARQHPYVDGFGNICRRIDMAPGTLALTCEGLCRDGGEPDPVVRDARQVPVNELPDDAYVFLLGSRYCETDLMAGLAWGMFGGIEGGWARVQAIVDYAHSQLTFSYPLARPTRTASQANEERLGVCRDFAHLAITLCRCMNIPARYCNGYLGDIGVPRDPAPMDFSAWFEAYVGDRWYTFDARHNRPRTGRIVIARGRDATDVPMINTFGPHLLRRFEVTTEEVQGQGALAAE